MELRLDRAGLLLDQLDSACELVRPRLEGMRDEEFLWEPVAGMWSIRRRADATTSSAHGPGEWVLDLDRPEPSPAPLTTIAWRVGHLHSCFAGRWEWTFGERRADPHDVVDFSPHASEAVAAMWGSIEAWRAGVAGLSDEQLDTVGFGQYPHGLDPDLPIIGIVWWCNRELIHHLAEISLLRDLWAHH